MMKTLKIIASLGIFLQIISCTALKTSQFDKSNTVGRNVDVVITEINQSGFLCAPKHTAKQAITNKTIGWVVCSIKEKTPICPDSFHISLGFDLATNMITSIGKREIKNCF